jgi:hypothetical protein
LTGQTAASHFTKWDVLILAVLVLIGISITVWIYFPNAAADSSSVLLLEIRQNGKLQKTLPLSEDYEETIAAADGQSNTFIIKDKTVFMENANCGDHTCIQTGNIQHAGESIVCLPHRLVLQIVSSDTDNTSGEPDVIVH